MLHANIKRFFHFYLLYLYFFINELHSGFVYLTEEDAKLFDGSIGIMQRMYQTLRELPVKEALKDLSELDEKTQTRYVRKDQKDTRYFDIIAENAISTGDYSSGHLDLFQRVLGKSGVIITEECGRIPREIMIEHDTPVIISDPLDISIYIEDIAKTDSSGTLGQLFDRELKKDPKKHRRHASSSSVTLLRDNMIKYTIILNLFTGEVYVGSPNGVFMGDIAIATSVKDITKDVEFSNLETLNMVCYTVPGKYEQNIFGTHLRFFPLMRDLS